MLARSENGAANTEGQDYGPAAGRVKPGGARANRPVSPAPVRTGDDWRPVPLSGRGARSTLAATPVLASGRRDWTAGAQSCPISASCGAVGLPC